MPAESLIPMSLTPVLPRVPALVTRTRDPVSTIIGAARAKGAAIARAVLVAGIAAMPGATSAAAQPQAAPDAGYSLRRGGEEPAPAAAAAPAPARPPVRSETTSFNNWTLTCREALPAAGAAAGKKACWGSMRVTDAKSQQVVLVWLIGRDARNVATTSVQTPTGVVVREGVTVALGRNTHRLAFDWCDQNGCEAAGAFDAAFARDLSLAKEATIAFRSRDGRQVTVKVPVAGADRLLAALPR